jgi:hypothetical protein
MVLHRPVEPAPVIDMWDFPPSPAMLSENKSFNLDPRGDSASSAPPLHLPSSKCQLK